MNARDVLLDEARNHNNWKRTCKKKYDIWMCMPRPGKSVTNFLEGSHYVTNENKPFVLSGTVGECWTVDAKKLFKTYRLFGGQPLTVDYLKSKMVNGKLDWIHLETVADGQVNWAFFLNPRKYGVQAVTNFPVQTSWGETLLANRPEVKHGMGDFLVCTDNNGLPNFNDMWVVNGAIFPNTYDMRAFPGLTGVQMKQGRQTTPRPNTRVL